MAPWSVGVLLATEGSEGRGKGRGKKKKVWGWNAVVILIGVEFVKMTLWVDVPSLKTVFDYTTLPVV